MSAYKGGTALNWDYYPADFKTKAEEDRELEKACEADSQYVLPPRKRQKTMPFNSTTSHEAASGKASEKPDIQYPIQPRLYNSDSIDNKRRTLSISDHKITTSGFQNHCLCEGFKQKWWLCAKDTGDAQIAQYWDDFENELGRDYEFEEIEDCHPVKNRTVTSKEWQLMKSKANVAIEARKKKTKFAAFTLAKAWLNVTRNAKVE